MTLNCDLDLESAIRVISSAHCLTEINIWMTFIENYSKGSGGMEQTSNSKGKTHDFEL